jgi:Bacterial regulatory proteins, tetR family
VILRPWGDGPSDRRNYHHGNLKEALVEAARRFIAERGIGGFTLVDAARLVGVTPAALYRHFRGREALLEELAGRGFAELAARLARALTSRGTPLERFTRMGETYLAFAEEEPAYYAAIFETRGRHATASGPEVASGSLDPEARPSPFDPLKCGLWPTAWRPFRPPGICPAARDFPTGTSSCGPACSLSSMARPGRASVQGPGHLERRERHSHVNRVHMNSGAQP